MFSMRFMKPWRLIPIVIALVGLVNLNRLSVGAKPAAAKKILLYYYLCDQSAFRWTWEDSFQPRRHVFSYGMGRMKIVPPPPGSKTKQIVKFLRSQLPNAKIWRDAVDKGVVHFAYRPVLSWSKYPLNKKLTFKGTMSFLQLESSSFRLLIPSVHFLEPPPRPGSSAGLSGFVPSNSGPLMVVTHFGEKAVTLRRFLTTGIKYRTARGASRELWQAAVYRLKSGKFTGHVDIYFCATPRFVPAQKRSGAEK